MPTSTTEETKIVKVNLRESDVNEAIIAAALTYLAGSPHTIDKNFQPAVVKEIAGGATVSFLLAKRGP